MAASGRAASVSGVKWRRPSSNSAGTSVSLAMRSAGVHSGRPRDANRTATSNTAASTATTIKNLRMCDGCRKSGFDSIMTHKRGTACPCRDLADQLIEPLQVLFEPDQRFVDPCFAGFST